MFLSKITRTDEKLSLKKWVIIDLLSLLKDFCQQKIVILPDQYQSMIWFMQVIIKINKLKYHGEIRIMFLQFVYLLLN